MRRAFTLVEMMVAVALTLALSGAVLVYIWRLMDAQDRMQTAASQSAGVEMLFARLEDDLVGVIAGDPRLGAGVKGDATSLTLLCRGTPPLGVAGAGGDLVRMEIRFEEEEGTVFGLRSSAGTDGGGDDAAEDVFAADAGAIPRGEILIDGVRELRLRYRKGGSWSDTFDSGSDEGLPEAVEVAVWFRGAGESEQEPTGAMDDLSRPAPDRLRVIVVPDAPSAAWGSGS